jgi:hypothetical protein
MRFRAAIITLVVAAAFGATAAAHHYAEATFDFDKKVTVTGTLTRVDWRNPHIEFMMDVAAASKHEAWKIETNAPNWFRTRNIARTNFDNAIGKPITVEASRARDGSTYGLLDKITFPDGLTVTMGEGNR